MPKHPRPMRQNRQKKHQKNVKKSQPRILPSQPNLDFVPIPTFGAAELKLRSTAVLLAQERRLAIAKQRREHELACRGRRAESENHRRHKVTQQTLQRKWQEDANREAVAHELRCNNESIVLQRQV